MPRVTPLVIPLGQGYSLERLSSALGEPQRAGILPPVPYGWAGSGLAVPGQILAALLHNLADSLREDGFTRVYLLTPQDLDLGLGAEQIRLFHPSQTAATAFSAARRPAQPGDRAAGRAHRAARLPPADEHR